MTELLDLDVMEKCAGLHGLGRPESLALISELKAERDQNLRLYHGRTYAEYLKKRRADSEARITAALELHFDGGGGYCAACSSYEEGIELPCSTVLALTGKAS